MITRAAPSATGLSLEQPHQANRIGFNSFGNLEELHNVEAPLTGLIFGDERLMFAEPLCDLGLRKLAFLALLTQERLKMTLSGRVD
jgi:hypothetical protein